MIYRILLLISLCTVSHIQAANVRGDFNGPRPFAQDDLAVYEAKTGSWFIRTLSGELLAFAEQWGFPSAIPVRGDYNGDRKADLSVYDTKTGAWYIKTLGTNRLLVFGEVWGDSSMISVPGDFNGDGQSDLAVYQESTGRWYIRTLSGKLLVFGDVWGGPGMIPVAGDYTGNGQSDLAVYEMKTGSWFVRSLSGELIAFAEQWGASDMLPAPGDYNGDRKWDMAVYQKKTGAWFIKSLGTGQLISFGDIWGDKDSVPLGGDYDADGRTDLAVYNPKTAKWYIRNLSGKPLVFNQEWGIPGRTVPPGLYLHGGAKALLTPPLEEAIGSRGPNGGFVWKPHSESTGKLVVLLPNSLTDGYREAWIKNQDGEIIEKGSFAGATHNGGREHYRFSKHGNGYGNVFLVSQDRSGNLVHWPIPSGANRWDY